MALGSDHQRQVAIPELDLSHFRQMCGFVLADIGIDVSWFATPIKFPTQSTYYLDTEPRRLADRESEKLVRQLLKP
jgi:hypothetical protein